jgi:hypothetical protein
MTRKIIVIVAAVGTIIAVVVLATHFVILQGSGTTPISVDVGSAQAVEVLLNIPTGNLSLTGGATALIDGSASYDLPAFRPAVDYAVRGDEGSLTIVQPVSPESQGLSGDAYPFDLRLNDDVPMDLTVRQELGEAHLNLTALSVGMVDVITGASSDVIELTQPHPTLTRLSVTTNENADTMTVNCECPSLLDLELVGGGGTDTIELSGSYATLSALSVEAGTEDDRLTITGDYPALVSGVISLGAGNDNLTLMGSYNSTSNLIVNIGTGDDLVVLGEGWQQSLNLTVISEGDTTSVQLPRDVGVYIEIASRSNTVNAEGFTQDGNTFVNDAYGESDVTLNVNINTTPNEVITLTLGEG